MNINDDKPLEPRDKPGTRPSLDVLGLWVQVVLIQLGIEKRAAEKDEKKGETKS